MWSPDPSDIITAEQKADEAAAAKRKADFPDLEPDQFWFIVRASGYEADLYAWLHTLDPVERAAASSKLEYAKYFERDHPFIEAARTALGMSAEELDALWRYAL